MGGNVRDWVGGIRTVYGELQILDNNNGADSLISQSAGSEDWKAINASDGTLIQPNGSGTTPGSVKTDWISNKIVYSTSITDAEPGSHYCNFGVIEADSTIGESTKLLLKALGLLPRDANVLGKSNVCYINNAEAERSFFCGGDYSNTAYGFAAFFGDRPRSSSGASIGFRSAFVVLPSA